MQYGNHFLALIRNSSLCLSSLSEIEPFSSRRMILFLSCFMTIHNASALMGAPVKRLHISLALDSFLKGCSFTQSLTYGNEQVRRIGPVPVLASCGISPSP